MIDSTFSIYQVLGAIALAIIGTGIFPMVMRYLFSRQERGVAIDGKVSDGWKRYAVNLEKDLARKDARIEQLEKENQEKEQALYLCQDQLAECGRTNKDLEHLAKTLRQVRQSEAEAKTLEVETAKEELKEVVEEKVGNLKP